MNKTTTVKDVSQELGYFPFMSTDEKTIYNTKGILNNLAKGYLVLTDKKLFFYFFSNISRDKKFIATHSYIKSAELKEGFIYSTLKIDTEKESFTIGKISKKSAKEFCSILNNIITDNSK
jgi:hypothetical protein